MSVAVLLLAAGAASRMRGGDKLLETVAGEPLLRRGARTALASRADAVIAVTGANRAAREAALADLPVRLLHNADWAAGMGSSIAAGVRALDSEARGVMVMPADMPDLTPALLDRLIAALPPDAPRAIARPRAPSGERGNPVLFGAAHIPALAGLSGDEGARAVVARHRADLILVPASDDAVLTDLDTPEAWAAYRAKGTP